MGGRRLPGYCAVGLGVSPHKHRAGAELPPGEGLACRQAGGLLPPHVPVPPSLTPDCGWCPPKLHGEWGSLVLSPMLCPQLADVESSPSKEEDEDDDDTMQNTVVLFSNTDKFVLMQVTGALPDRQVDGTGQTVGLPQLLSPPAPAPLTASLP